MKKIIFVITVAIVAVCSFSGCEKEDMSQTKGKTYNALPKVLQELYDQMPARNYNNISVIGDGILRLQSIEDYEQICSDLSEDCERWDDLFLNYYANASAEVLDSIEYMLNYNEFQPLIEFERNYSIFGNTIRDIQESAIESWLSNGMVGKMPMDPIIGDEVEQTLFNQYREICIGDTVYQLRSDGMVLIPIDSLRNISQYRTMTLAELSDILTVKMISTNNESGHYWLPIDWDHEIILSSLEKSFCSVRGRNNIIHNGNYTPKMVSKIYNYKYNSRSNKWQKVRRNCSITCNVIFFWLEINSTGTPIDSGYTRAYTNTVSEKKRRYRKDVVKGSIICNNNRIIGVKKYPDVLISINGHRYDTQISL